MVIERPELPVDLKRAARRGTGCTPGDETKKPADPLDQLAFLLVAEEGFEPPTQGL